MRFGGMTYDDRISVSSGNSGAAVHVFPFQRKGALPHPEQVAGVPNANTSSARRPPTAWNQNGVCEVEWSRVSDQTPLADRLMMTSLMPPTCSSAPTPKIVNHCWKLLRGPSAV